VLDGYAYFASAAEAVRGPGPGNAPGVIVVGIGYPDDSAFVRSVFTRRRPIPAWFTSRPPFIAAPYLERTYDLTLPATDRELTAQGMPEFRDSKNVGGLDDFLRTIETEVKPRVAAISRVDLRNQVLFGHSFGGLAVLHALFVEPGAFRTFIAASPSIWWNNKEVLADEAKFETAVRSGQASPRVLVTMGSEESTPPAAVPPSWGLDAAVLAAQVRQTHMVDNGRQLVERLKAVHGSVNYVVEDYAVFEKLSHGLAPWPALARGISFAFSPEHVP